MDMLTGVTIASLKPKSESLTTELHEIFSLAFQVLLHFDPSIQPLNVITQIKRLSSSNPQSSAYHFSSAASNTCSHKAVLIP